MPVEIWSRVMKPAHQGVAVAGLPGLQSGPRTAGLPPLFGPPSPAAPSPRAATREASAQPSGGGIDTWLIDRLFGRR